MHMGDEKYFDDIQRNMTKNELYIYLTFTVTSVVSELQLVAVVLILKKNIFTVISERGLLSLIISIWYKC